MDRRDIEEALSRAVADSSDLRVAAEAANQARDQAVTAAQSWEERAHAAVAETVARSKEGTARGGTVAMLHSELGGVKRLLEAERAANAKLSAELVVSPPDASSGPLCSAWQWSCHGMVMWSWRPLSDLVLVF